MRFDQLKFLSSILKNKKFIAFFSASFATAAFTYLAQLVLARRMGSVEFSHFSTGWSLISTYLLTGTFSLYWAAANFENFKKLRSTMLLLEVLAIAAFVSSLSVQNTPSWIALLLQNIIHGFLLGVCLQAESFAAVNFLNLVSSGLRFALVLLIPTQVLDPRLLYLFFFAALAASHLLFWFKFKNLNTAAGRENPAASWAGPLLIALMLGFLPQVDLLWAQNFLQASAIKKMVELSLISKSAFFLQMILSQWMIPRWVHHKSTVSARSGSLLSLGLGVAAVIVGAGLLGSLAYCLLPALLGWSAGNTWFDFVFISLLGASMAIFAFFFQALALQRKLLSVLLVTIPPCLGLLIMGWLSCDLREYLRITPLLFAFAGICSQRMTQGKPQLE